jgi:hypothetical protein
MSRCCGGFSASAVMYLGKIVEIAGARSARTCARSGSRVSSGTTASRSPHATSR